MIRLLGILTGSALAVTGIFVMFGVPELTGATEKPTAMTIERPIAAPLTKAPPANAKPASAQALSESDESQTADAPATGTAEEIDPPADDALAIEPEAPVEDFEEAVVSPALVPATDVPPQHWYAFWSPFRSELAADGFISELQRTTGLDYRVVKLKPGVYEVAFAYSDPIDRQDKLDRIAAATGLDMSGG